jgi:hypothetical protein
MWSATSTEESIDKGNDVEPVQRGISVPVIKNTKKQK